MKLDSLALALSYLERHLYTRYLFPIKKGKKFPPLIRNNLEDASNDPAQIAAWVKQFGQVNWGVAHRKSKLLVADIDTNEAKGKTGQLTYDMLEMLYGWPETETTTTPSGGFHKIYEGWADENHPEHIMALGENGIGKDIDSPNYTLIPGCTFDDGTSYVGNDAPAVRCPEWIYDTIKTAKTKSRITDAGEVVVELDQPANIELAIDFLKNDAEPAIQGQGGDINTYKTAAYLKDLGISPQLAPELLNEYYNPRCQPPWDMDDLVKKVASAFAYTNLSKAGGKTAEADFSDDPPEPITPMGNKKKIAAQRKERTQARAREAAKAPNERERTYTRQEVIDEWVWIIGIERFINKANPKLMWKKSAFDSAFAYIPKKSEPKSFSECLFKNKKGTVARFQEIGFQPGQPQALDSGRVFNLYTTPDIVPAEGDIQWWNDHLEYLFPEPEYRDHVLNWMAWLLQNLTLKPKHALIVQGPEQGTGKSFIAKLLSRLIHTNNTSIVSQSNLRSDFNGWATHAKLLVIEELRAVERAEVAQNLHDIISEDRITINEKNLPLREIDNCFGIFAMTNNDAALVIDNSDRRYLIVRTEARPRSAAYYDALYARLRDDAALGAVMYSLLNRKLVEYSGQQAAPATEAKTMMLEAGMTDLEQFLIENAGEWPLSGRVVAVEDIIAILPKRLENKSARMYGTIRNILKTRFDGQDLKQCPTPSGKRPRLIAINGSGNILMGQSRTKAGDIYEGDKIKAGKNLPLEDLDASEEFRDNE
jgi:hypothetical protein